MIEKIRGIKIKGKCFKDETDFIFFKENTDRIALVYGKNGSGKTTISDGVAASCNKSLFPDLSSNLVDENLKVLDISDDNDKVFIFNEHYVDQNIKIDDDGLGTIILFGQQTDIQTQIEKCEKEIDEAKKNFDKSEQEINKYNDPSNPLSPDYHWKRIQDVLKRKDGWAEIDSLIKGNRRNSSVTDDIIQDICKLSTSLTVEQLKTQFKEKKRFVGKNERYFVYFS